MCGCTRRRSDRCSAPGQVPRSRPRRAPAGFHVTFAWQILAHAEQSQDPFVIKALAQTTFGAALDEGFVDGRGSSSDASTLLHVKYSPAIAPRWTAFAVAAKVAPARLRRIEAILGGIGCFNEGQSDGERR